MTKVMLSTAAIINAAAGRREHLKRKIAKRAGHVQAQDASAATETATKRTMKRQQKRVITPTGSIVSAWIGTIENMAQSYTII